MLTKWSVAILTIVAVAVIGGVVLQRAGGLSARAEPTAVERLIARAVRRWAVPRDARAARNPVPFSPDVWAEARAHFADHCATCHANDTSGHTTLGPNLYPKPPDMRLPATEDLSDGELYWIIENGVRLTGMPAFGDGGPNDTDTWKLVHFIRHAKELTPQHLKEMEAYNPRSPAEAEEEREEDRFLSGEQVEPPVTPPHHQHE